MAEIINLNKYRKARKRTDESKQAAENRVRHGRTKGEQVRDSKGRLRSERVLDGKRIDTTDDDQEPA